MRRLRKGRARRSRGRGGLLVAALVAGTLASACGGEESATKTSGETVEASSRPSLIAFVSDRNGNDEIYVMNPDGSRVRSLTETPENEGEPVWSPDGGEIAFTAPRGPRKGFYYTFVMNSDGSDPRLLTESQRLETFSPAWSPDGSRIAYVTENELWVMNADGGDGHKVMEGHVYSQRPAWSPDGTLIAFEGLVGAWTDIFVVEPGGTGLRNVTNTPNRFERSPAWSPDGKLIAFERYRWTDDTDIHVMNLDGSGQRNLTNKPALIHTSPTWSPDGSQIAYAKQIQTRPGGGYPVSQYDIFVMNADGSNHRNVSKSPAQEGAPSWSPDL